MSDTTVAFIFARGGSRGIPRKNLQLLAGRPLIVHSIETALECSLVDRVLVSTEDEEIAAVARENGAWVPFMRPTELASDDAPEWLAWQHALRWVIEEGGLSVSTFVSLPPTSPLRAVADIDDCIGKLQTSGADIVVTVTEADRNPYFNMVCFDDAGDVQRLALCGGSISRRQDAPAVYSMTTVAYAASPAYVLSARGLFEGRMTAAIVPRERAVDIDTLLDLEYAEFLMDRRRRDR